MQSIVPLERWDMDGFYDPQGTAGKLYTRIAAFVQVNFCTAVYCALTPQRQECHFMSTARTSMYAL